MSLKLPTNLFPSRAPSFWVERVALPGKWPGRPGQLAPYGRKARGAGHVAISAIGVGGLKQEGGHVGRFVGLEVAIATVSTGCPGAGSEDGG